VILTKTALFIINDMAVGYTALFSRQSVAVAAARHTPTGTLADQLVVADERFARC